MSDYMAAEIWIGGKIPKRLVPRLCQAISEEGVSLEWGDSRFEPATENDLVEACREEAGVLLLHLCDEDARYGQFAELEEFLIENKISFRRRSEAKFEHDAELVEFRRQTGLVRFPTNSSGQPLVPLAVLEDTEEALADALAGASRDSFAKFVARIVRVKRRLRKHLPPAVPELAPLEIGVKAQEVVRG